MKGSRPLVRSKRARRLSLSAACLAFFLAIVEPANASSNMQQVFITIPSDQVSAPELPAVDPLDPNPGVPSLLELDSIKVVDASVMARISIAARQVESARQADGAKEGARQIIAQKYRWSARQFTCLDNLWTKESKWNYKARNKSSGAHGIAQALPATKMEIVGTDWRTNPVTQITWGLKYIEERYEYPCRAWSKSKRSNWY
ncbi:MAG: transglycosylase SLT domain-containing protein [Candidatus Nanopelagicaceae bacterium]